MTLSITTFSITTFSTTTLSTMGSFVTLSLTTPPFSWVSRLIYCYAECHYAECRYAEGGFAECHYAECHCAEYKVPNKFVQFLKQFMVARQQWMELKMINVKCLWNRLQVSTVGVGNKQPTIRPVTSRPSPRPTSGPTRAECYKTFDVRNNNKLECLSLANISSLV